MKNVLHPLLTIAFIIAHAPVLSDDRAPVSTITTALWEQYKKEYKPSPLCSKEEITLWSCNTGKKVYSLCSSKVVNRTSGYMQYRASNQGKVIFTYPTEKTPPLGYFIYTTYGSGNATVDFTNNDYEYTLFDPLREQSSITVTAPPPSKKRTEINCGANQTLQVNYTMRLMYDAGVWEGH